MRKAVIEVQVTYTTTIEKEISDDLYADIEDCVYREIDAYEKGHLATVFDFISDNAKESNATDWTVEVQDIYDED